MASPDLPAVILTLLALLCAGAGAVEILSNSHRETCVRDSDLAGDHLSCDQKIVVNAAVPSGSSGAEASVVANIAETAVDNNTGTKETKYIRDPPVDVTISKSAVYAAYDLVYLRDVAYKPVDETRKCEPDAGADVVQSCERSSGKILRVNVPPFEASSQVGTANVTFKNIGKLEASYSLTFNCSSGINRLEEQSFTMKPEEESIRLFYLHTLTDQAAEYQCTAILKASDSSDLDKGECRFSTAATVLNNRTQIVPPDEHKKGGTMGFLETVKAFWRWLWDSVSSFFTGSTKCSSFFDSRCHFQYLRIGRVAIYVPNLATVLTVAMLAWFLHRKGYLDPLYNWWRGLFGLAPHHRARKNHKTGHHRHSQRQSHHRHRSGPSHRHHHILHRREEDEPGTAAGGPQHRHDLRALSVKHKDMLHVSTAPIPDAEQGRAVDDLEVEHQDPKRSKRKIKPNPKYIGPEWK